MSGLLDGVLPYIYSRSDALKRQLGGLLADPSGVLAQAVNDANDRAGGLLQMTRAAAAEGMAYGPASQRLAGLLAASYNPVAMVSNPLKSNPAGMAPYQGEKLAADYQIDHRPMTTAAGAAQLHNLEPAFGQDIYGPNALQYFGSGDPRERAIVKTLNSVRGKPDATVTIYRGVPDGVDRINPGDWVTLDPSIAADYGNVVRLEVPASHVTGWADSLMEFGYHPPK